MLLFFGRFIMNSNYLAPLVIRDTGFTVKQAHEYLLPICWIFLIDISVLLVMYFHRKWSYILHLLLGIIVCGVTIGLSVPLLLSYGLSGPSFVRTLHYRLGFALLIYTFLQVILGIALRLKQVNPDSRSLTTHFIRRMHQIFGYLLIIFCKVQIFVMIRRNVLMLCGISVWQAIIIALLIKRKFFTKTIDKTMVNCYVVERIKESGEMMLRVTNKSEMGQITKNYTHFAFFDNHCYSLADLKQMHPVGYQVVRSVEGRDLQRYLFGMYNSQELPEIPLHSHSKDSLSILGMPLAKINIAPTYTGFLNTLMKVRVAYKVPVQYQSSTYQVGLELISSPQGFKFQGYTKLAQVGRFYCLSLNESVTRLYTQANFLHARNKEVMKSMFPQMGESNYKTNVSKTFNVEMESQSNRTPLADLSHCEDNVLPLLIKRYNDGPMTKALLGEKENFQSLMLSEPRGFGLEWDTVKPGKIIIVAGGTGIVPFCDAIDIAFKNCLVVEKHPLAGQLLKNDPVLKTNPFKEFSLSIFAAFESLADIHPLTLKQIAYICKFKKRFSCIMKFQKRPDTIPESIMLTENNFEEVLKIQVQKPFSKIWVCGPPRMNQKLLAFLKTQGIVQDKYLIL